MLSGSARASESERDVGAEKKLLLGWEFLRIVRVKRAVGIVGVGM
jgi:hypothetical protein